jgi:class 3 adenylate cyclase/CheY-like chemotaxis protein
MLERMRTITTLFTDMVGSTDQFAHLDAASAESLRGRYFAGLRGALAVHRGREVKTLGDGLMAVFESAGDAVGCAVTMQRAMAAHNRRHPELDLGLRVGCSTGEAACREGDYFGTPIVEASRLCAAAQEGQILVADVVRILAGSAGMHKLEPVGELALKGLQAPLTAWEVDWDRDEEFSLRVALADDSVLLREGVARVLEAEGIDVVLQVSDAEALLGALVAARPHVVVIDVRMPPTHTTEGLDAARHIRSEHPDIGVLVLSATVEPGAARNLLDGSTGGIGYMLKERVSDIDELAAAIRTVASGGSAIDPEVMARLDAAASTD